MIVNIVILVLIYLIFMSLPIIRGKKITFILLTSTIILQLIILAIYRNELYTIGRIVYFSDAEMYWNATMDYLKGNIVTAHNETYIIISALVQVTSPFIWVGWNNIYNILIVDLSTMMIISLVYKEKLEPYMQSCGHNKKANQIIIFTLLNPFIIYALMRNLKDATFVFLIVLSVYLYQYVILTNIKITIIVLYLSEIFLAIALLEIRPWGFIVPLIIILYDMLIIRKIKLYILFLLAAIFVLFFRSYFLLMIATLEMWIPIVMKTALPQLKGEIVVSIARLFVGPGPVRALNGHKFFMFTTNIGNFMCFIGNIFWYFQIGLYVYSTFSRKMIGPHRQARISSIYSHLILYVLIIFVIIYSAAYYGSVELRFRAVLYLLTTYFFTTKYAVFVTLESMLFASFIMVVLSITSILLA